MATRRDVANTLKEAGVSYMLKKGYSCFVELGLNSWGKLRGDVVCLNLRADIVILETKSSVADYTTDTKWQQYQQYANRLYFVFSQPVYEKLKERLKTDLRGSGVGVLILDPISGYLKVQVAARKKKMQGSTKRTMVIRMAWRSGRSKRMERRKRLYLQC
jgi:hypothetical protein